MCVYIYIYIHIIIIHRPTTPLCIYVANILQHYLRKPLNQASRWLGHARSCSFQNSARLDMEQVTRRRVRSQGPATPCQRAPPRTLESGGWGPRQFAGALLRGRKMARKIRLRIRAHKGSLETSRGSEVDPTKTRQGCATRLWNPKKKTFFKLALYHGPFLISSGRRCLGRRAPPSKATLRSAHLRPRVSGC